MNNNKIRRIFKDTREEENKVKKHDNKPLICKLKRIHSLHFHFLKSEFDTLRKDFRSRMTTLTRAYELSFFSSLQCT